MCPLECPLEKKNVTCRSVCSHGQDSLSSTALEKTSPGCLGRFHPLLGWSDTEETRQPLHQYWVRQWEEPMENRRIEPVRAPLVHREAQPFLQPPQWAKSLLA